MASGPVGQTSSGQRGASGATVGSVESKKKDKRYYDGFYDEWHMDVWWVLLLSIPMVSLALWIVGSDGTDSPSGLWGVPVLILSRWLLNGRFQRKRRAKVRAEERRVQDEERHVAAAKLRQEEAQARQVEAKARKELAKANFEDVPARIPRDADDFETVCAEWMKKAGFVDVERTPKGPDGGIDTIASDAVGQAKFHPSQKVTGESVRALVGSKIERKKKRALFFHYGPGYTPDAIAAARSTGVELYQLDVDKRRFKRIDK